jgi:hypothetical protein
MEPKQTRINGGSEMEQRYGRITIDYHYPVPSHRHNPDAIAEAIVRVLLAVGIGLVGILFVGIVIISSAI